MTKRAVPMTQPEAPIIVRPPPAAPLPITSPVWDTRTKRTIALICLVLIGIFLWGVSSTLPIIIVAAVLSYLLAPLTGWLEKRLGGQRGLAILLTFLVVILLFILLLFVIFPVIIAQVRDFVERLPDLAANLSARLDVILSQPLIFNGQPVMIDGQPLIPGEQLNGILGDEGFDPASLDLVGIARTALSSLTGSAFGVLGSAFRIFINGFLLVTLMFYLIKDGRRFADSVVRVVPVGYHNDMRRLIYELGQIWNAYLRGQLILCLVIGVLVFLAATILGVPNAPVLGLISGLLEFVPNIGPFIALIPAALLALASQSSTLPFLEGASFALVVVIVWTLIQNIESLVIVPRVMGDSLDLHPAVVIVGVLMGAAIGGALGVVLAAPMIATLRLFAQYLYGKLTDQDLMPAPRDKTPTPDPLGGLWARLRGGSKPAPVKSPSQSAR